MTLSDFHQRAARMLASPLTHPALLPRPRAQQLLRVWLAPSFTPAACWAWIRDGKQELLRRVVIDLGAGELRGGEVSGTRRNAPTCWNICAA